jgi:tRNA pseudouridine55 synthase
MLLNKTTFPEISKWLEIARLDGASALIDKPLGWTSFDVIAKLRRLTNIKKIGHAGTLDPLATGLLIVCLGKATKTIVNYQDLGKSYSAVIKIGATTATDDSEAEEENITDISNVNESSIIEAFKSFRGVIEQVPPKYSAKKVDGKRLYKLARKNIEVEIKPVSIEIQSLDIININLPYISFDVKCSKGTYIRSIARDIGAKLGIGAYLSSLRRISIGDYHVDSAVGLDDIATGLSNS